MTRYLSTRGGGDELSFTDVLLKGLMDDGGLAMPVVYPQLDIRRLRSLCAFWGFHTKDAYREVAWHVFRAFGPDVPEDAWAQIITCAFDEAKWRSPAITPLTSLARNRFLLGLSGGPTFAFKDTALQPLGAMLEHALTVRGGHLNLLGATSGDTGSAAIEAVRGKKHMNIFMLSPYGRMSEIQQAQMYSVRDTNVFNISIRGTFDDCQAIVKEVNADAAFKAACHIGAVNSINWARIMAQVVYNVYAFLRLWHEGVCTLNDGVVMSVPSGNLGNACSSYIAMRMGVPIRRIIVGTNENDVLHQFFRTGIYRVRKGGDVVETTSPSMDIAQASNLERLVFEGSGRDPVYVRRMYESVRTSGVFDASTILPQLRVFDSGRVDQGEVIETIRRVYRDDHVVIDPHTAVAMNLAYQGDYDIPVVVEETAAPVKFPATIHEALGFKVPLPPGFEDLLARPRRAEVMDPDPARVKEYIMRTLHR